MGVMNRGGSLYMATGIDNSGLHSGIQQAEGLIDGFESKVKKTGAAMAGYFAFGGLKEFGNEVINVRGEIQMMEKSFDVLVGKTKSKDLLSGIKDIAIKSPLSLTDTSNAAQTLLAFNVEVERVIPTLKQLGDISMGNADRFKSLALAFAQMHSTGRLMGQDLNQMINAGFNPLQVMAEKTGKTIAQLKKDMEGGSISAEMVADAFRQATEEGGKFNGMMEAQAEGIEGLKASFGDAITNMYNKLGEENEKLITDGYKLATTIVENYETIGKALLGLIATYGAYKAALITISVLENYRATRVVPDLAAQALMLSNATKTLTFSQWAQVKATTALNTATSILNKTMLANPYVLATTLILALGTAIYSYVSATDAGEKATDRFNNKIDEINQKSDERKSKVDQLISKIKDETTAEVERQTSLQELQKMYPKLFSNLDTEAIKTTNLIELKKELNEIEFERGKQERQTALSDIEKQIEATKKLKGVADTWGKTGSQLGLNTLFPGLGSAKQWYDDTNELKALNIEAEKFKKELKEIAEAEKKAEFDAKPAKEKLSILNQQLDSLKKERDELDSVLQKSGEVKNQWGGINWETSLNISKLKAIQGQMSEIMGQIANINGTTVAPVQNKSFWDEQKKSAISALEAMTKAQKGGEDWNKQMKLLNEANANLNTWDFSDKSAKASIKSYHEKLKAEKAFAEAMLDIEQHLNEQKINLMQEGIDKEKKLLDLKHQDEVKSIKNLREKAIDSYKEKNGIDSSTSQRTVKLFEESQKYKDFLTELDKSIGDAQAQALANNILNKVKLEQDAAKEIRVIREDMNSQFRTQLDNELIDIDRFYDEQIRIAKEKGYDIAIEAEEARKKAIEQVRGEDTLRKNTSDSSAALGAFDVQTSDLKNTEVVERRRTEIVLEYAKKRRDILKTMTDDQSKDELRQLEITIKGYEKALSKPKSIKGFIDQKTQDKVFNFYYKQGVLVKDAQAKVDGLNEKFQQYGGMASEALGAVKDAFGDISEEADMALDAALAIAEGFAKGGLAGGIEAAASQLISVTTKLLTAKKEVDKSMIEGYEAYMSAIDRLIDKQIKSLEQLSGKELASSMSDVTKNLTKQIEASRKLMQAVSDSGGGFFSHSVGYETEKMLKNFRKELRELGIQTANISEMTDDQLIKLMEIPEAWQYLNADIRKYIENLAEAKEELDNLDNTYKDLIISLDFDDIASAIIDSFTDPAIDDALVDFEGKVDGMVSGIIKNIMTKNFLVKPVTDMINELKDSITFDENNGILFDESAMKQFKDNLLQKGQEFSSLWKQMEESMSGLGIDMTGVTDAQRKAIEKGFASMNQDTANELNGKFASIQGHTYYISESVKLLVSNSNAMLKFTEGIKANTDKLEKIEDSMYSLETDISEIKRNGLILKK